MTEATGIRTEELGLFTDLYQLTMAESYYAHRQNHTATFSLFIRNYPPNRRYFVAAGLATVLDYLAQVRFPASACDYLRETGRFSADFLTYLQDWRFHGEVWAMPEGTVFFVNEPVLEVTAPIIEAQLVESFVVNAIHMQSLIATKASRCVQAAQGRSLIDFSLRRTHGTDAGMKVARASYLTGFVSTSNVLAGQHYGIPIAGTMAHAYVTCFAEEIDAFRAFAQTYPQQTVLLIDTYDTITGAQRAAIVGQEMAQRGQLLLGVRLDSGDMTQLSKEVRAILDATGLPDVKIVASGGYDEYAIAQALRDGACIDIFGVGTKMGVAADAPYFDMAYKLVKYDGRPVMKLSPGKVTLVEEKQVWRCTTAGQDAEDVIALRYEHLDLPHGRPLLQCVMRDGHLTQALPSLETSRALHAEQLAALPADTRVLEGQGHYPVHLSTSLAAMQQNIERTLGREGRRSESPGVDCQSEENVVRHPLDMATYRQRLVELRDQLVHRIYDLAETREGVTEPQIEFGDKAQAEAPAEVLARLDERSREEWEAIQAALARIEAGTYGKCDACGKAMTAARLDAMPMARLCLACQKKSETERKGT